MGEDKDVGEDVQDDVEVDKDVEEDVQDDVEEAKDVEEDVQDDVEEGDEVFIIKCLLLLLSLLLKDDSV